MLVEEWDLDPGPVCVQALVEHGPLPALGADSARGATCSSPHLQAVFVASRRLAAVAGDGGL